MSFNIPVISEAMELNSPLVSYEITDSSLPSSMNLNSALVSDTMSLTTPPVSYVQEELILPPSPMNLNSALVSDTMSLTTPPVSYVEEELDFPYVDSLTNLRPFSGKSGLPPVSYVEEKLVLPDSPRRIPEVKTVIKTPIQDITPRRNLPKPPAGMSPFYKKTPLPASPRRIIATPGTPPTPVMQVDENLQAQETRNVNSYELLGKLGSGGQGTVWKARVKSTGNIIALKIIKIKGTYNERQVIANQTKIEIDNLVKISSPRCQPYLACYYASHFDPMRSEMLIEMEYVEGMDLDKWARQNKSKPYFYAYLMAIMIKLCEAIQHINNLGLIHRDIKPQNILIRKDEPVLVDFGLACQSKICRTGTPDLSFTCCYGKAGTPVFMAPETIEDKSYFVTDIWGLGATIYYVASGRYHYPFVNVNDTKEVLQTIIYQQPFLLNTPSYKLNNAINSCLNKNYLNRITVDQLLSLLLSK